MKWVLSAIAAANLAGTAAVLAYRPELYGWLGFVTDIAFTALAVFAWMPQHKEA